MNIISSKNEEFLAGLKDQLQDGRSDREVHSWDTYSLKLSKMSAGSYHNLRKKRYWKRRQKTLIEKCKVVHNFTEKGNSSLISFQHEIKRKDFICSTIQRWKILKNVLAFSSVQDWKILKNVFAFYLRRHSAVCKIEMLNSVTEFAAQRGVEACSLIWG